MATRHARRFVRQKGADVGRGPVRPLARWRVYPRGDGKRQGPYAVVQVWADREAYARHVREAVGRRADRRERGMWDGYLRIRVDARGRSRTLPELGTVNLFVGALSTEVVTHEFAHAALSFARRHGLDFAELADDERAVGSHEERFCYALSNMVLQFVERAHARGLDGTYGSA